MRLVGNKPSSKRRHHRIITRWEVTAIVLFLFCTGENTGLLPLERVSSFSIGRIAHHHYQHHRPRIDCPSTVHRNSLLDRNERNKLDTTQRSTSLEAWSTSAAAAVQAISSSAAAVSKRFRVASVALIVVGLLLAVSTRKGFRRRLLYPGLPASENMPEHLGCPLIGILGDIGHDPDLGAGTIYRKTAAKVARSLAGRVPRVFRYYFLGATYAVVSGGNTLQKLLRLEFDAMTSNGVEMMEGGLFPMKGLLFEPDKTKHSYLRRLVGSALTPEEVARAAPTLQSLAEARVSAMLDSTNTNDPNGGETVVELHEVCTDYTVDVARRQILGLELDAEELPVFRTSVADWARDLVSNRVLLGIAVEATAGYRGREWIARKIEERIDQLLADGEDGASSSSSTLAGMVFATDDDGKRLTREEIVGNALALIIAGSETSASTLTNALLFLGLHPSVWDQLQTEQRHLQEAHGSVLDARTLDAAEAPFLDAVLKETLRMRTVWALIPRKTLKDIRIDGTTIRKGHLIDASPLLTHQEDPSTKLPDLMHLDAIQGFRPERWLPHDKGGNRYPTPDPDWHVPFGFGPRHCLGKHLAVLEMKIFLATALRSMAFPKLTALPPGYDYSPEKKNPGDPGYFSVEWSTLGSLIPVPADGARAAVAPAHTTGATSKNEKYLSAPITTTITTKEWGGSHAEDARLAAGLVEKAVTLCLRFREDLQNEGDTEAAASQEISSSANERNKPQDTTTASSFDKADGTPVTALDFAIQGYVWASLKRYERTMSLGNTTCFVGEEDARDLRTNHHLANRALGLAQSLDPTITPDEFWEAFENPPATTAEQAHRSWILDPIDGTKGLLSGQHCAVGLCLCLDGEASVGVLGIPSPGLPNTERVMVAARGHGIRYFAADTWHKVPRKNDWHLRDYDWDVDGSHPPYFISRGPKLPRANLPKAPLPFGPYGRPTDLCCGSLVKEYALAKGEAAGFLQRSASGNAKVWDHAAGLLCILESGGSVHVVEDDDESIRDGGGETTTTTLLPLRFDGPTLRIDNGLVCSSREADLHLVEQFLASVREAENPAKQGLATAGTTSKNETNR